MESGLFAIGMLSFVYYFLMGWYTKRWNNTFSGFWITFGLFNIVLGFAVSTAPKWFDYVVVGIVTVLGLFFFAVEILILCAMVSVVPENMDCLIILGARLRGERITEALKRRLDRGLRYLQENPKTVCVVSGGQGKGENIKEAEAMAEYLIACGIERNRIYLETESTSTYENLEKSLRFVQKKGKTGIVTNNFHIYRTMKLAKYLEYQKVYAVPASCNPIMFPNYMVREFFAFIKMYCRVLKK